MHLRVPKGTLKHNGKDYAGESDLNRIYKMGETKGKVILSLNILQILKTAKRPCVRIRKSIEKNFLFFLLRKGTK